MAEERRPPASLRAERVKNPSSSRTETEDDERGSGAIQGDGNLQRSFVKQRSKAFSRPSGSKRRLGVRFHLF
jgi:hypothetical protein